MNRVVTFLLLVSLALPSSAIAGKQRRLQRKAARQAAKCPPVSTPQQILQAGDFYTDACGNEFYVDECCRLRILPLNQGTACPEVKLGTAPGGLCFWLVSNCDGQTSTVIGECHEPCECNGNECPMCPSVAKLGEVNTPPPIPPIDARTKTNTQNMRSNHRLKIRTKRTLLTDFSEVVADGTVAVTHQPFIATLPNENKHFALFTFTYGITGEQQYHFAVRCKKSLSRHIEVGDVSQLIVSGTKRSKQEGRLTVKGVEYHLFGRVGNQS